jgi:hypothetical protein
VLLQFFFKKESDRQQEERASCLAVEDEDVGVHPLVEGRLGYHEHAGVDQLYGDGHAVRLHACLHLQQVTQCAGEELRV